MVVRLWELTRGLLLAPVLRRWRAGGAGHRVEVPSASSSVVILFFIPVTDARWRRGNQ